MQFISNKKWDALQLQLKAVQTNSLAQLINNFSTKIFPSWGVVKEMDAYQNVNQVYSVVKKLATCSAMIPFYGYDKKGEDLPETDNLVTFLNTLDFEEKEKLYTNFYLFAEYFGYKNRTELGVNGGQLNSLVSLHPYRMIVYLSGDFPRQITGYNYYEVETGISQDLPLDEVVFVKTYNPTTDPLREFRGLSPVSVLARVITRIKSAQDAVVGQLQNGVVPGIEFDKFAQAEVEVTGNRKNDFSKFIKNPANKGAPYFAGNELGYIELGTPLADMEVIEMATLDMDEVCNAYGVSSVLFNDTSASTESNVKQMKTEMYENTIIPNVYRIEAALNKYALPDIKTKGVIKCDTSEIKALQEDQAALVTALAGAWWIAPNEKRERMMYDQSEDELMDKFLVPSNLVPLEDLVMPDPINNAAGDYAPGQANVVPIRQANG